MGAEDVARLTNLLGYRKVGSCAHLAPFLVRVVPTAAPTVPVAARKRAVPGASFPYFSLAVDPTLESSNLSRWQTRGRLGSLVASFRTIPPRVNFVVFSKRFVFLSAKKMHQNIPHDDQCFPTPVDRVTKLMYGHAVPRLLVSTTQIVSAANEDSAIENLLPRWYASRGPELSVFLRDDLHPCRNRERRRIKNQNQTNRTCRHLFSPATLPTQHAQGPLSIQKSAESHPGPYPDAYFLLSRTALPPHIAHRPSCGIVPLVLPHILGPDEDLFLRLREGRPDPFVPIPVVRVIVQQPRSLYNDLLWRCVFFVSLD